MNNPKYQIFKDRKKQFRFRLKAANGKIILASEGYKNKAGAKTGIKSAKTAAKNQKRFDLNETRSGKFHFNLLASNNKTIGSSETYNSKKSAMKGVKSVMNNGPKAPVEDTTD